jgi:hypothetical protein
MVNFKVLEITGEGKADVGKSDAELPNSGVIPILVHTLCGKPADMRVKRRPVSFLHGKGWWQKIRFAKQQAFYNRSAGAVVVLDTEGDHKGRMADLVKGRGFGLAEFPMAVGAAHACIEAWLLADAIAIAQGMGLTTPPQVPDQPEQLLAPQHNRKNNPKTVLAECAGASKSELSAAEKDRIALAMKNMSLVRTRCPVGFAPFANEVELLIKPIFEASV